MLRFKKGDIFYSTFNQEKEFLITDVRSESYEYCYRDKGSDMPWQCAPIGLFIRNATGLTLAPRKKKYPKRKTQLS